jgi:hypothetical protein
LHKEIRQLNIGQKSLPDAHDGRFYSKDQLTTLRGQIKLFDALFPADNKETLAFQTYMSRDIL